jgi:hypothetical protein
VSPRWIASSLHADSFQEGAMKMSQRAIMAACSAAGQPTAQGSLDFNFSRQVVAVVTN